MASAAQLLPLACLLTAFLGAATAPNSTTELTRQDARLLFKFITISPDRCNSVSGGVGICYSKQDCSSLVGTSDGNCAKGLGVCCTFTRTCGQQTKYPNTTFTNPSYPSTETTVIGQCELTVFPMNDNICQVRLDFVDFTLDQPNGDGTCLSDVMTVTGASVFVPIICGDNAGQHMYIDVEPNSTGNIKINIDTSTAGAKWKIIVTQIECTSKNRAPDGCLQYFTETSGVVSSFNYKMSTAQPTIQRQLSNQHYGVCIQSRPGYCSVTWEKPAGEGSYFFSMTGDPTSVPPNTTGPAEFGDVCTVDYVIIPGGNYVANSPSVSGSADRFCGISFPTSVESSVTPYVLYVVTDTDESLSTPPDSLNQGFSLKYRANVCTNSG